MLQEFNPLPELLELIPDNGIVLTEPYLNVLATLFARAGIEFTSYNDVINALVLLDTIVELEQINDRLKLKKVKYGE